jgi:hypothetical protein
VGVVQVIKECENQEASPNTTSEDAANLQRSMSCTNPSPRKETIVPPSVAPLEGDIPSIWTVDEYVNCAVPVNTELKSMLLTDTLTFPSIKDGGLEHASLLSSMRNAGERFPSKLHCI